MADNRVFMDNFFHPNENPRPFFLIAGAQELPVYQSAVYGDEQLGYCVLYTLVKTVQGIEAPQNNAALLQNMVAPPNPPFAPQFRHVGWLPGHQRPMANFLPVYWPMVMGNGVVADYVAYSLAVFVPTLYLNPYSPMGQQPSPQLPVPFFTKFPVLYWNY